MRLLPACVEMLLGGNFQRPVTGEPGKVTAAKGPVFLPHSYGQSTATFRR